MKDARRADIAGSPKKRKHASLAKIARFSRITLEVASCPLYLPSKPCTDHVANGAAGALQGFSARCTGAGPVGAQAPLVPHVATRPSSTANGCSRPGSSRPLVASYDDALAENINALHKAELIDRQGP